MTINSPQETTGDYSHLAVLKAIAIDGGAESEISVSGIGLETELNLSADRTKSLLCDLEETGLIIRRDTESGCCVRLTREGVDRLRAEYFEFRDVFKSVPVVSMTGTVVDGMGEGKHYISLDGYQRQFQEQLGYEPFPGTLNVELDDKSVYRRRHIERLDGLRIDEWEDEERTYGGATCYPVNIRSDSESFERTHILVPDRSQHDDQVIEAIAPVKLRDALSLESGDEVTLDVSD
jgi:riboflavin kinase